MVSTALTFSSYGGPDVLQFSEIDIRSLVRAKCGFVC
jgi:hypothetical protein